MHIYVNRCKKSTDHFDIHIWKTYLYICRCSTVYVQTCRWRTLRCTTPPATAIYRAVYATMAVCPFIWKLTYETAYGHRGIYGHVYGHGQWGGAYQRPPLVCTRGRSLVTILNFCSVAWYTAWYMSWYMVWPLN